MPLALARAMNERVAGSLSLDGLYACFHDDGDGCDCRKPKPGLLLRAAAELDIDLGASSMVGDRWKDVAAGASAGCETFFIDRGYSEPRPSRCDHVVASLGEAADILIEGIREEKRK
jgi:D-glycero-D-manno-heptose 1,7-bisphosphate phosphatase